MVRTQVLLDPALHAALRRAAAAQGKGMSALVREILRATLGSPRRRGRRRYGFTFVGKGASGLHDVSERHDDYLNEGRRW